MAARTALSPSPVPAGPLVRMDSAKQLTGLSDKVIRKAVKDGDLVAYRPGGERGPLLFTTHDLMAYVASTRVAS